MSTVQIRGLMKVHRANRRAANEQARELQHLRHRAYRGVEVTSPTVGQEVHGTFVYRGHTYTK
jgi:Ser/Thr protein kinase RdoA (MazF antagonist)